MGLLSYLRGDDLLEDRSTHAPSEARSLPPAENQWRRDGLCAWSDHAVRCRDELLRMARFPSGLPARAR